MNNINFDRAVACVKNIADANRCPTCDQLKTICVKYPCGHSICKNCIVTWEYCVLCPLIPNSPPQLTDEFLNPRVKHASNLVTAFEEFYNTNVNRRSRISEQLKLEKEIFPKCIQAPAKYSNKRKSFTSDKVRKILKTESFLNEENIFRSIKMENKIDVVQQWLNDNEISNKQYVRKPLQNLNVNNLAFSNKQNDTSYNGTSIVSISRCRKRTHLRTFSDTSKKKFKKSMSSDPVLRQTKFDTDESGIVIDDDIDIIDDSQGEVNANDKNKQVSMTLKDYGEVTTNLYDSLYNEEAYPVCSQSYVTDAKESTKKVLFYKKSAILDTCKLCNDFNTSLFEKNKNRTNMNNFTVTVDSKTFVANITVSNCLNKTKEAKKSVCVQTDMVKQDLDHKGLGLEINTNNNQNATVIKKGGDNLNEELVIVDMDNQKDIVPVVSPNVFIEDSDVSDTDSAILQSFIEVSAEVHRSCNANDYEVLNPLNIEECVNRTRHAARGHTPNSTDSSDKENYDPNRLRRSKRRDKKCDRKK